MKKYMRAKEYSEKYGEKLHTGYWGVLASAIVLQAANDYRSLLRGGISSYRCNMDELELFFTSEWYESLTGLDADGLKKMLIEEFERGEQLVDAGNKVISHKLHDKREFDCPLCGGTATAQIVRKRGGKPKGQLRLCYKEYSCARCKTVERREAYISLDTGEIVEIAETIGGDEG